MGALYRNVAMWVVLVLLSGCVHAVGAWERSKTLAMYVPLAMQSWDVPGVAVAVVRRDSVIFSKGFGRLHATRPDKVNPQTLFALGQLTQSFTAAAAAALVGQGMLAWDAPVDSLVPSLLLADGCVRQALTLRDLLAHRCGYKSGAGDLLWQGSSLSRAEIVSRLRFLPPTASFRAQFGHSNLMYLVAAMATEAATGRSWDGLVEQTLLLPLQLQRTRTSLRPADGVKNVATPHRQLRGTPEPVSLPVLDNIAPSCGMWASVQDCAVWLRFQLSGGRWRGKQLVDSASMAALFTPQIPLPLPPSCGGHFPAGNLQAAGMGWMLRDYRGRLVICRSTVQGGMAAAAACMPGEDFGVVVLTNCEDHCLHDALVLQIIDWQLGIESSDWSTVLLAQRSPGVRPDSTVVPQSPADVSDPVLDESLCGRYHNQLLGEAHIQRHNDTLVLLLNQHPDVRAVMQRRHRDTLAVVWHDPSLDTGRVVVTADSTGQPSGFGLFLKSRIDPLFYGFTRLQQ